MLFFFVWVGILTVVFACLEGKGREGKRPYLTGVRFG